MESITITKRASREIENFRDDEYLLFCKANICDAFCLIVENFNQDTASINFPKEIANEYINLLAVLFDYCDLVKELSKTEE